MELEVKDVQATYHRNGIGGVGFFIIAFLAKDGDSLPEWEPMLAFSFGTTDPEEVKEGDEHQHCVGVVMAKDLVEAYPNNLQHVNAWRGADYFWPLLRPEVEESMTAYYRSIGVPV